MSKEVQKGLQIRLSRKFIMPNKNLTFAVLIIIVFSLPYYCYAQDTLSKMTLYGNKDSYKKSIDKEFIKLNNMYHTGIRHGIYYMYDIVDIDNRLTSEYDTLLFLNEHIYHVVSPSVYGKVSMIIIPYNDTLFAFIGLNCCKRKHDVEDVIHWVLDHYQNVDYSTLENIRNYKNFHPNIPIDPQGSTPICEWRCRHNPSKTRYHYRKPKIIHCIKDISKNR